MSDHEHHPTQPVHHHDCGNLFGCGDVKGDGILRSDIQEAASTKSAMDRLLHMDEMDQERLDSYLARLQNQAGARPLVMATAVARHCVVAGRRWLRGVLTIKRRLAGATTTVRAE